MWFDSYTDLALHLVLQESAVSGFKRWDVNFLRSPAEQVARNFDKELNDGVELALFPYVAAFHFVLYGAVLPKLETSAAADSEGQPVKTLARKGFVFKLNSYTTSPAPCQLDKVAVALSDYFSEKFGLPVNLNLAEAKHEPPVPQQTEDSNDCGPAVVHFAKKLTSNLEEFIENPMSEEIFDFDAEPTYRAQREAANTLIDQKVGLNVPTAAAVEPVAAPEKPVAAPEDSDDDGSLFGNSN